MSDVLITPGSSKIEFKDASNNIDGTIKLDSDGNLELTSGNGISFGDVTSDVFIGNGTDNVDLKFEADGSITGTSGVTLTLGSSNSNIAIASDATFSVNSNGLIQVRTNNTERLRIDTAGRLFISTTSTSAVTGGSVNGKFFDVVDGCRLMSSRSNTAAREHAVFHNPNGDVGDITTSGSSTSFNTSSDYRLKENEVLISDGITRLKTLKPYRFNFKADANTTVDGFFAHEVTAVPEAITGTKDEVDSDNNPVYQGIDHSKLVPLLTAALQEAITEIETLKAKVAALEDK